MRVKYKSYKSEYSDQEQPENTLVRTDPKIKRPDCPICHSDTYVTPMEYGLPEIKEIEEHAVGTNREEFASATYSCVVEPYNWDCAHCFIRF